MLIYVYPFPGHDGYDVVDAHLAPEFTFGYLRFSLGHARLLIQISPFGADAQDVQVLSHGNECISGLVSGTYLFAACRYLRFPQVQR